MRNLLALIAMQVAERMRNVLTERESAMDDDPVINSLIYLLMFFGLLEYWLLTGVL